jgi:nitrate reductase gamma subunit
MGGSTSQFHHLDILLWAVLPYVALFLFFFVTIQRYRRQSFSYSSLSSQFLENRQHFWGMVPFHYGILVVLAGHVAAFLVPRTLLWWNARPLRLYLLEVSALIFALLTLVGFVNIILRRLGNAKLREVTTPADWMLYVLLLVQVFTGIGVAVFHGWGSSWFSSALTPYLWSLVRLNPDITFVIPLPWLVQAHLVGAWVLIAFFPFTRLVHILVIPNMYLWRRTQVVRWNWERRTIRESGRAWKRSREVGVD